MDPHTFYLYDTIYKPNPFLYKQVWSIKKNKDRTNYIHYRFVKIDNRLLCNRFVENWRVGMPKIKKIYYITSYFNYYDYNVYVFIANTHKDVTYSNVKYLIQINNINNYSLYQQLTKYNPSIIYLIHPIFNKKKKYTINYVIFLLNQVYIPKDIIFLIIQYLV
jgi:hypothetical protein